MMKRNVLLTGAVAAVICLSVGCEWTGTSSEESWNDAYSWVNFSGTYNLYNIDEDTAGTLATVQTTLNQETVTESQGTVIKGQKAYSLNLSNTPIVAGSVTVKIGNYTANDDGDETLSGSGIANGTLVYSTGEGSVTLVDTPGDFDAGKAITVTYTYTYEGENIDPGTPPTPGSAIRYYTINQQGNLLTFNDNRGTVFSGRITGANVPSDSRTSGNIRLNFEVTASNGAKIIGTLSGDWSGGATGTLANRLLRGTYSRGGTHVELQGASGSISITPRPITSD